MSEKVESTGMELLKEIANVSGKGGLFRILKPSRAGVIVESLDEKREKTLIGPTARVSVLKDVSIFTEGEEESVPLEDVFTSIREAHGEQVELPVKTSSDKELIEFLNKILPDFDRSKVYVSDIKKIITWYNLLSKYLPELFIVSETAAEPATEEVKEEAEDTEKKSAKKAQSKA
ncbi:hypothetical protein DYBT9623_03783 [Dyadobacter sp. CECT 9623]|jgi:hypothetical protein|uniref:DUF5606 domain-containing protein n=1 Tax=Dyadobacter linearis TaxID=2823330 RepID=A0ABM8UU77_9BACT|nr:MULTISPECIES: DUF5606 domain-containing protein [unclassified Dyadobacter]MCE7062633.1 DUF5606 domain-containing protein [Dyadobacter sp. CY343]CAG5071797.1 hypothetical protein DYBT9623_03783 [Dyadobacter sp. CECT 9623]